MKASFHHWRCISQILPSCISLILRTIFLIFSKPYLSDSKSAKIGGGGEKGPALIVKASYYLLLTAETTSDLKLCYLNNNYKRLTGRQKVTKNQTKKLIVKASNHQHKSVISESCEKLEKMGSSLA